MSDQKRWVQSIFDAAAPKYSLSGTEFFPYFGEKLVELAQVNSGSRVLDVATGRGAIPFPLIHAVGDLGSVVGVDLSSQMISETQNVLQQKGIEGVSLQQMDAEKLDFPDASFDHVFCGFALFFFPHLQAALAEFLRVLKPGGHLAVSVWGGKSALLSWLAEEGKRLGAEKSISTTPLGDFESLRASLEKAGFSDTTFHEERTVVWYPSAEDWFESLWHHGTRAILEQLSQEDLEELFKHALLKAESLKTPRGIPEEFHAIFGIAQRGK